VQEQLGSVAFAVGAELEAIQGGLQRRVDIAAARAMLELMQDTAHVMSKVRDLHAFLGDRTEEIRLHFLGDRHALRRSTCTC
jgi:hypothetical protein